MDIMFNLNTDQWEKAEADQVNDLVVYRISRRQMVSPGVFKYSVGKVDEGMPIMATLTGACGKSDPLQGVANCELLLDEEFNILGINVDGDCAVKKSK